MGQWAAGDEITATKLNENRGFFEIAARAYKNSSQRIEDGTDTIAIFNNEDYDEGSDFDSRLITGAADATEALKLHDADGGFTADLVGATVWNTTDKTYAKVTAFVDSGELTLDNDIMVSGETYEIHFSKFVVPENGFYLIRAAIYWTSSVDQSYHNVWIKKNGGVAGLNLIQGSSIRSSGTGAFSQVVSIIAKLEADDFIQIEIVQGTGSNVNIGTIGTTKASYLEIIRIA